MKALIAMSGGVDSSVAAYLMKQQGYDCLGMTMRLFDPDVEQEKSCCTSDDIKDAEHVCDVLNIPFEVENFTDHFKREVIDRFVLAYETGTTPNPCIDCNRYIKFKRFFDMAKQLDYDYIVTGHYARVEQKDGKFYLKKAKDLSKDQSYVLYSLTQQQLQHIKFPLGELSKDEVRQIAENQDFINADKPDSQDICFVVNGDYASVIEHYSNKKYPEGDFVDLQGNVLGKHKGIIRYTIGQRKGLGLSLPESLYVCKKDVENNKVVLCKNEQLFSSEVYVKDFNWILGQAPEHPVKVSAKIRYNQVEKPATATVLENGIVHLAFDEPQRAIAAGQSAVVYDGDIVLGGGIII